MLRFEFDLDDSGPTSVLSDCAEPRTLMIWDTDQQLFEEYVIGDLELDTDAGELRIGVDCELPHQISEFPQWMRPSIRESWNLRVQSPIAEWEHVDRGESLDSDKSRIDELMRWLFTGRSKHDSA